jgi:hypothetical protein
MVRDQLQNESGRPFWNTSNPYSLPNHSPPGANQREQVLNQSIFICFAARQGLGFSVGRCHLGAATVVRVFLGHNPADRFMVETR